MGTFLLTSRQHTFNCLLGSSTSMFLGHLKPNRYQTKPSSVPPPPISQARKPRKSTPLPTFLLPKPSQSPSPAYPLSLTQLTLTLPPPPPGHHLTSAVSTRSRPPVSSPVSLQLFLQTTASDSSRKDLTLSFHCSFYSFNNYLLSTYYMSNTLLSGESTRNKPDKGIPVSRNSLFKTIWYFQEETKM